MDLAKFIPKGCIVPDLDVSTKADAIKELTHLLFEKKKMDGVSAALDQILAREITESTGIGQGIAVPHTRITGMKSLMCAVGRVPDGLDFMAIDHKPVYLIFLICYPPTQQTTYLNFVATLAKLLGDKAHFDELMAADTSEAIKNVLSEVSEKFTEQHEKTGKKIAADPNIENIPDAHADLVLLARLQLCEEMLVNARSGKREIRNRIENIRSLVTPRILKHYDRVVKSRAPGLVPVEGDTCQGCFMKLPSRLVQQIRQDSDHIHTCPNCSRYIYVV